MKKMQLAEDIEDKTLLAHPYCITIDHQTKDDNTITIRERDSMQQDRIPLTDIEKYIKDKVSFNSITFKNVIHYTDYSFLLILIFHSKYIHWEFKFLKTLNQI